MSGYPVELWIMVSIFLSVPILLSFMALWALYNPPHTWKFDPIRWICEPSYRRSLRQENQSQVY